MPGNKDAKAYITPLEILTNRDLNRKKSFFSDKYSTVMGALFGCGIAMLTNIKRRKPAVSGVQVIGIFTGIGAAIGYFGDTDGSTRLATKDAILRHYIELHPADFPPIERKKYRDILEPWAPIR